MPFPHSLRRMLARFLPATLVCLTWLPLLGGDRVSAQTLAQRWLKTYTSPTWGYDQGRMVEIGPDGHVVMVGYAAITNYNSDIRAAKYHGSTGELIWERRSQPSSTASSEVPQGFTLDSQGNAIVVGGRNNGFYAAKYAAADGAVLWQRTIAASQSAYFTAIDADAQDNLIITGTRRVSGGSPIESDIYTYKLDGATGDTVWINAFDSPDSGTTTDQARALALDGEGNAFVTGYATFGQYVECVTLKISGATGTSLWVQQRRDSGTSGSSGDVVAVDAAGNCHVVSNTPQGYAGFRVVKYRGTDGTQLWVNVQDGPQRDQGNAIAVDSAGNAVVTGFTYDSNRHEDIITRKINGTNGTTAWTKTFDGGITSQGYLKSDIGNAVRFDRNNNVVVAGYSNAASGNGPEPMVFRYATSDGSTMLSQRLTTVGGGWAANPWGPPSLAVGPGHITMTGHIDSRDGSDAFVVRLNDPAGATLATLPATGIGGGSAALHGQVNPNGTAVTARFEYGTNPASLTSQTPVQSLGNGFAMQAVSATITGLPSATTYYYRVRTDGGQTQFGEVRSFTTPSNNARLASVGLGSGELQPAFSPEIPDYLATVPFSSATLAVTPVTEHPKATATVNDLPAGAGGVPVALPVGTSTIVIRVTAEDGIATTAHRITVTRLPEEFVFRSAEDVPVTADGFSAGNLPVAIRLEYSPAPGTSLVMVENTGAGFISGRFAGLAQGQRVSLSHGPATFDFVANYYGGSGNDLVLQWADTAFAGWGAADQGQLGDPEQLANVPSPLAIDLGTLAGGRTAFATASGYLHGLCLFSDGKVAAWGHNVYGQAGNSPASAAAVPPGLVDSGALAGKAVIAIAAGAFHNLALCEDGSLAAWGYNNHGQLGDGSTLASAVPVAVQAGGALAGKTVVAIAAGDYHSLALCSDGTVAGWGFNGTGCLGNGTTVGSTVPVAVAAIPGGRKARSISAGGYHSLALCHDGTLAAWGYNTTGQLGDGSRTTRLSPVTLASSGALSRRIVTAISGGASHSLALCGDGSLVAWGEAGRCGVADSTGDQLRPVQAPLPAGTEGKIAMLSAGAEHGHAVLKDGRVLFWGHDSRGQSGDGSTGTLVATPGFGIPDFPFPVFTSLSRGASAFHQLAIVPGQTGAATDALGAMASAAEMSAHELAWWAAYFGPAGPTADEADLADPDHDGIPNLIEYAFGLNPNGPDAGELPRWRREGNDMVLRFTAPSLVTGMSYQVFAADHPAAEEWQEVQDLGSAPGHHFRVPIEGPRRFMRMEVNRNRD